MFYQPASQKFLLLKVKKKEKKSLSKPSVTMVVQMVVQHIIQFSKFDYCCLNYLNMLKGHNSAAICGSLTLICPAYQRTMSRMREPRDVLSQFLVHIL